ncbi:MAG: DUF2892 domain-containing protein [Gammaproteobacteria bacterium]|nr:DUF2892 domain-containing protein [Gammaproteobacteria bacterium]MDH3538263.1 DUF2892 domain-containing protein [Gammaproteobacteria bacterium]
MQKNVGSIDRVIRALVGVALLAVYFLGTLQGALGIGALVVGIVMLGTAAIGWCPPYALLGINTCGVRHKSQNA